MNSRNLTYTVKLEDLRIEAVLDSGFLGDLSFSDEVHAHAYYELVWAVAGSIRIESPQSATVQLCVGEVCLIPSGFYHRVRADEEGSGKLAVRFHCTKAGKGCLYQNFFGALSQQHTPLFLGNQPQFCLCLQTLRRELCTPDLAQAPYLQSLLVQLFCLLMRQLPTDVQSHSPVTEEDLSRRLQLEEYLQQNFHAPITEAIAAEYMHLSKRQLSRVIREIYGKSFRHLLIDIRLHYAAQLLTETDLPVEEIALRAGYTSLSGFYDAFRKYSGSTAGQYRKFSGNLP